MCLGRDINGTPLYVGDRVRLVGSAVKTKHLGEEHTIIKKCTDPIVATLLGPEAIILGDGGITLCKSCLRVSRYRKEEVSSWAELECVAGWKPEDVVLKWVPSAPPKE